MPTCSRPLERGAGAGGHPVPARRAGRIAGAALLQMQEMAARYGCDMRPPGARTAREAVQWLYFALPGGGEVAERRRHVAGAHGHLPRHLFIETRSARRFIE
ncbi:hypothetical protein LNP17_19335 [Klebsiella variicola subsp. variicola]|nr:hypothetical protein [Klebsiella variicola subsp. variicola]